MAGWTVPQLGLRADTAIDQVPVLECRVEQARGSFMGYLPPKAGDRIVLDVKGLQQTGDKLQFASGNYIPLNGVLNLIQQRRGAEGRIAALRWRSEALGAGAVTLDVRSCLVKMSK
jgi:hypothetical protein